MIAVARLSSRVAQVLVRLRARQDSGQVRIDVRAIGIDLEAGKTAGKLVLVP